MYWIVRWTQRKLVWTCWKRDADGPQLWKPWKNENRMERASLLVKTLLFPCTLSTRLGLYPCAASLLSQTRMRNTWLNKGRRGKQTVVFCVVAKNSFIGKRSIWRWNPRGEAKVSGMEATTTKKKKNHYFSPQTGGNREVEDTLPWEGTARQRIVEFHHPVSCTEGGEGSGKTAWRWHGKWMEFP